MAAGDVVPIRRRGRERHRAVVPREAMPDLRCPFCDSDETEPDAIYGCHMMFAPYYCRSCRTSFDWVRDD